MKFKASMAVLKIRITTATCFEREIIQFAKIWKKIEKSEIGSCWGLKWMLESSLIQCTINYL